MTAGEAISTLTGLETSFMQVAQLARDLQSELTVTAKFATGNASLDVVTQADYAVQRGLLELLVKSPLRDCQLFAEEDSPELAELQKQFTGSSGLVLTLDPVDGTRRFVEGAPFYSTIVGLTDGKNPIYSWLYYPSMNWWFRMTDGYEESGPSPFTIRLSGAEQFIVHSSGSQLSEVPDWLASEDLRVEDFRNGEVLGPEGSKMLFMQGGARGYLARRPNAYDGLVGLHFALLHGFRVVRAPSFDLSCPESTPTGWVYPGGYLVLRNA
jgi:fructose-1,6-bisphosphatase/inositol monophosphatase family enzyme